MSTPIGAKATIRWNDSKEISENYYFSFEDFPEGSDPDTYVLPLANILDEQVFMYCSAEDFTEYVNTPEGDFTILDYRLVTN